MATDMKEKLFVGPDATRPEVYPEAQLQLRYRLEIRPSCAVDYFRQRGEIDANELAGFTQGPLPDCPLDVTGEQPRNLVDGVYRRHVRPVGNAISRVRAVRPGHTTSVDDGLEVPA